MDRCRTLIQPTRPDGFATLEEATRALEGPVYDTDFAVGYVGDTMIDVALRSESARGLFEMPPKS